MLVSQDRPIISIIAFVELWSTATLWLKNQTHVTFSIPYLQIVRSSIKNV